MKKTIHLICNAHLDPVWLWEWQEGAAEAISTFRVAADFCEEYDGFVFNHNEVILYEWVEEYEPQLFKRIQRLVKAGKWQIMGGWYLQPDCNMPAGESFVRQILLGRTYFRKKFGVVPTTAINFDPFGHSRGLVQILAKSGFDSYYFGRPDPKERELPGETFIWEGFDGSRILASRAFAMYLSQRGAAREKVENFIQSFTGDLQCGAVCWGVGNHGGGPSRIDLKRLTELMHERDDIEIRHSTMEAYFKDVAKQKDKLLVYADDMNPFAVGCYTSQVRVKQKHRELENELYMTEKMATLAWALNRQEAYPEKELHEAMRTLAQAEFHDILPGSSIQPVEESSLRLMDYGLELLARIKARAFFALAAGQAKADEGKIPILVFNPHPFPVDAVVACELQLADQNIKNTFTDITVTRDGEALPTQVEKEASNINLDWRKRVVFRAELAPSTMNRFDCILSGKAEKPVPDSEPQAGKFVFRHAGTVIEINSETGLLDRYEVNGKNYLAKNAFQPIVMQDNEDPWGMRVTAFTEKIGAFKLMTAGESARHAGVQARELPPVRVVEDGAVRTLVEAAFTYSNSQLLLQYGIPKAGGALEIKVRVHWGEKDKMLKLSIPSTLTEDALFLGQTAYGVQKLPGDHKEAVAQKWVALIKDGEAVCLMNNGTYGYDSSAGEIRATLLRSSAYSGHPIADREIVPQNRFSPRIEQGERLFHFRFNAGREEAIMCAIDRDALALNEKPMALSFFPSGDGTVPAPGVLVDGNIILTACKRAENGEGMILRLFEPRGIATEATVSIPFEETEKRWAWSPFEIKTLFFNFTLKQWYETNLMEDLNP